VASMYHEGDFDRVIPGSLGDIDSTERSQK
jgi:hypothetical protein